MERLTSSGNTTVSYEKSGSGPPLVLVHGAFSDHETNWEFVKPEFRERFTVYAIARRGRGDTDATEGHSLEDEARDVVAVIRRVHKPVFLLGHSYGAHCALVAAHAAPERVRKLVLYEPAWPAALSTVALATLEDLAAASNWPEFAWTFFKDLVGVPVHELEALPQTPLWQPIVSDAKASLGDLRAMHRYHFVPERYRQLDIPVLLQVGTESARDLYVTDALAAVLSDARVEELPGQAHEGMTTAPGMYVRSVTSFLLGESSHDGQLPLDLQSP
jgi:pimeloyl-ACP methyl ester carboxylesterase